MADTTERGTDGTAATPQDNDNTPMRRTREQRRQASELRLRRRAQEQQWRDEFPYHWRADDLVTRRDTLRFLVAGSGALFVATAALAVVGNVIPQEAAPMVRIATLGELASNQSKVFNYPDSFAQGILINLPGKGLVAYSDVCTHLSCAVLYEPDKRRLHCPCHEGLFDAATGEVLGGPPSRPLPLIQLQIIGNNVYAVKMVNR
jgi:Rieske Fe-S protein